MGCLLYTEPCAGYCIRHTLCHPENVSVVQMRKHAHKRLGIFRPYGHRCCKKLTKEINMDEHG